MIDRAVPAHAVHEFSPMEERYAVCVFVINEGNKLLRQLERMEPFCGEHGVAFERCGKVVVAVDKAEVPRFAKLYERGRQNGLACRLIGPAELAELEPHAAGLMALHVPETGIVDFVGVCGKLAELAVERGTRLELCARVLGRREKGGHTLLETTTGS